MTKEETQPLFTTEDVAELLNIEPVTVRKFVRSGKLQAYRVAGRYRFDGQQLRTYLESCRVEKKQNE